MIAMKEILRFASIFSSEAILFYWVMATHTELKVERKDHCVIVAPP